MTDREAKQALVRLLENAQGLLSVAHDLCAEPRGPAAQHVLAAFRELNHALDELDGRGLPRGGPAGGAPRR